MHNSIRRMSTVDRIPLELSSRDYLELKRSVGFLE